MKKNNSKILFLCQFSYPEYNSSSTLPFDTARYLASQGYSVDIMCGYPKEYNRVGKVPTRETIDDVRIHRLRYIQLNRMGKAGRLINYFSYTMSAFLHIVEMRKYDLIASLVSNQLASGADWDIVTYSVDGTGSSQVPWSMSTTAYVMIPDEETVETAKALMQAVLAGEIVEEP